MKIIFLPLLLFCGFKIFAQDIPALHVAIQQRDVPKIQALIAAGADVNEKAGEYGHTPLIATMYEFANTKIPAPHIALEITQTLLAAGADPNIRNNYLQTALFSAMSLKNEEIIKLFLDAGVDVNAQDSVGFTALMWAATQGDNEGIKTLAAAGTNINLMSIGMFGERSAIAIAIIWGQNIETIKLLHAAGADIHVQNDFGPALTAAAARGDLEIIKFLLSVGAETDINAQSKDGKTALMSAVGASGQPEIVKFFIAAGSEINTQDNNGETALHWAVRRGDIDIVKILLEAGVETNKKNKAGKTPRQVAEELHYTNIVKLFNGEIIPPVKLWRETMGNDMTWTDYHDFIRKKYHYPQSLRERFIKGEANGKEFGGLIDPTSLPLEEWQRFTDIALKIAFQRTKNYMNFGLISGEASVIDFNAKFVYVLFLFPHMDPPYPEDDFLCWIKMDRKTGEFLAYSIGTPFQFPLFKNPALSVEGLQGW